MRILLFLIVYCSLVNSSCVFHAEDKHNQGAEEKIKKWKIYEKNLTISNNGIKYSVGICSSVGNSTSSIGITQTENDIIYSLGKLDNVNLVGQDNWILLTYENGDRYNNSCDNTTRSSSIMFVCGQDMNNLTVLQEHTTNDPHCNFIFLLQVPEMCPPPVVVTIDNKLSGGAIFVIIIFCVAVVYLVAGALFMHIKRGARGIDHIPNLNIWRKLGHLSADGCDFCCRCDDGAPRAGYFLDGTGPEIRGGDDDILPP